MLLLRKSYKAKRNDCSFPSGQPLIQSPCIMSFTGSLDPSKVEDSGSSSTSMTSSRRSLEKKMPEMPLADGFHVGELLFACVWVNLARISPCLVIGVIVNIIIN